MAIYAVAASILTAAYDTLRDGNCDREIGAGHSKRTTPQAQADGLVRKLAKLGPNCSLATGPTEVVSVYTNFRK